MKEEVQRSADAGSEEWLRCRACDLEVTTRSLRIDMSGAHAHAFVNPNGVRFEIGCFAAAPGCVDWGQASEAFSWFPGWSWQIAVCGRCSRHLGWHYRLAEGTFHGLILADLR